MLEKLGMQLLFIKVREKVIIKVLSQYDWFLILQYRKKLYRPGSMLFEDKIIIVISNMLL